MYECMLKPWLNEYPTCFVTVSGSGLVFFFFLPFFFLPFDFLTDVTSISPSPRVFRDADILYTASGPRTGTELAPIFSGKCLLYSLELLLLLAVDAVAKVFFSGLCLPRSKG